VSSYCGVIPLATVLRRPVYVARFISGFKNRRVSVLPYAQALPAAATSAAEALRAKTGPKLICPARPAGGAAARCRIGAVHACQLAFAKRLIRRPSSGQHGNELCSAVSKLGLASRIDRPAAPVWILRAPLQHGPGSAPLEPRTSRTCCLQNEQGRTLLHVSESHAATQQR